MKKKIIKTAIVFALAVICAGCIVYFWFPGTLVELTNSYYARNAGLKKHTVVVDGYEVNYFYSNSSSKKETIVLVHGMGDDKNSFLQTAASLSKDYNLLLPDLAGHGENEKRQGFDYSIHGQVQFLHDFLTKLEVKKFHLVGNSMGGHTSAAYAIAFPDKLSSLTLLNSAGLKLDDHVVYTGFGKPIQNKEELGKLLQRVFYKPPSLPGPVANYMIEMINSNLDFTDNTLVPAIKGGQDFDLTSKISNITAPTLVLWGKHDVVVPFSHAQYFDQHIPNSELLILPNAAHSPQLEIPDEVGESIFQFLQRL